MKTATTIPTILTALCLCSGGVSSKAHSMDNNDNHHRGRNKTVILFVRHAEPDTSVAHDPPLSAEGRARALALVQAARKAAGGVKIHLIFTTQFACTQETAQPLAEALSLKPRVIQANNTFETANRLKKYKHRGILVVGHRNTIPEIIRFLSSKEIPPIAAHEYDNIFVLTLEIEEDDDGIETQTVQIETKKYGF